MQQEQQQRQQVVTGQQSLVLVKNMLRLSLSSVCYQRGIFPSNLFSSRNYAGVNVHQLEAADKTPEGKVIVRHPEAFLLTQWLEKGVFDALESQYLKSMIFAIYCKDPFSEDDMLLETYQFHVSYPDKDKAAISLNGMPMTRDTLKKQAVSFIRSLVEFSGTLELLPEDRWLTLKLTYFDDITPPDYEPEYFKCANSKDKDGNSVCEMKFSRKPLRVKVGKLDTGYSRVECKFAGLETLFEESINPIISTINKKLSVEELNKQGKQGVSTGASIPIETPVAKRGDECKDTSTMENSSCLMANKHTNGETKVVKEKVDNQNRVTSSEQIEVPTILADPLIKKQAMINDYATPKVTLIDQVKAFITNTGKANISDCLEHLEQLETQAFFMKRLEQQNNRSKDQSSPMSEDDSDDEGVVDRQQLREIFKQLVNENFIVAKGNRYSTINSRSNTNSTRPPSALSTYTKPKVNDTGKISSTLNLDTSDVGNTKRKLSYDDGKDEFSSTPQPQEHKDTKARYFELSQDQDSSGETHPPKKLKSSIISDPIHQKGKHTGKDYHAKHNENTKIIQ